MHRGRGAAGAQVRRARLGRGGTLTLTLTLTLRYVVRAGFFEIYRGKCADLLNKKKKIEVV